MDIATTRTFKRLIRLNRTAQPVHVTVPAITPMEIEQEREVLTRLATFAVEEGLDFHALVSWWHLCLVALECESNPALVTYIGQQLGQASAEATLATAKKLIGWVMATEAIGDSQVMA